MKNKIIYVLLIIIYFFSFNSFAINENIDVYTKKQLTLSDILSIALANNPQIKQAWLNVDVGNYNYKMQLSDAFPTINGELSYSQNKNEYKNKTINTTKNKTITPSITFDYLLFNFNGRASNILDFKYRLNAINFETNNFVQNFIYKVVKAYYDVFSALANEKASKEIENSSYEAFKSASVRYNIGLVPLTDKLQAETSYTQNRLVREKAENATKIKKAELNYLLNISPTIDLQLAIPVLDISNDTYDEDIVQLIEKALNNRPDLKAYYESKKAKKMEVYSKTTNWLPTISLGMSYSYIDDLEKSTNIDRNNYSIGINAKMPFFTGGYVYNNVAKAKGELKIIDQQIKDLEKNIELDVWTTYQDFITAKKVYMTSQILLKSATEAEKTILGRYKNGKSSILDLLDAQSNLAVARYEVISSQHNWFISRANLIRSLGQISQNELENLINTSSIDNIPNNN